MLLVLEVAEELVDIPFGNMSRLFLHLVSLATYLFVLDLPLVLSHLQLFLELEVIQFFVARLKFLYWLVRFGFEVALMMTQLFLDDLFFDELFEFL